MSERQLAELTGNLVRHQHCFGAMSNDDRQWTINNPAAAIGLFAEAVKNRNSGTAAERKSLEKKKQPKLLVSDGHYAAVEATERHEPGTFWQTRSGLYVYDDFRTRVVAAATPTEAGATFKKLPRFKLGRNATGEELKTARPNGIWTATDFCPWLAAKLAKQAKGEDGEFLTNGWANLFLVEGVGGEVFVVRVRWGVGLWLVYAWPLGHGWHDGRQFGSRN